MSRGRSSFSGGLLGGLLGAAFGPSLARLTRAAARWLAGALGTALLWVWWQWDQLTANPRLSLVLTGVTLLLVVLGVRFGVRLLSGTAALVRLRLQLAHAPTGRPGQPPHVLYRWWEPDDLPTGLVCACGKPRVPGSRIYVGETNNVARRHGRDDDRLTACWFVPGIVGRMQTYPTEAAAVAAESWAIRHEGYRENIAGAGVR